MRNRVGGENTTLETRLESETTINKNLRYIQILDTLGNKEMTAKEIAVDMYLQGMIPTDERNFVSPRLTELLYQGIVEVIGKTKCDWTGKTVSVFRRRMNENSTL